MSVIINASNSTGLTLTSDLSGQLQFQNNGVNLPMGGVAPAFSGQVSSSNQSVSSGVWTKVQISVKQFDTNNNFDATTNYRFTPTVAGYYQLNGVINSASSGATPSRTICSIYKNGTEYVRGGDVVSGYASVVSAVIYFNGSTDYAELWGFVTSATTPSITGTAQSNFSGCLVRGA